MTGRAWYAATIREILRNDKYTGKFVWAKQREEKYHRVSGDEVHTRTDPHVTQDNPPEAWTVVENAHQALVSQEIFDQVQQKLERRKRRPKGEQYPYSRHTKSNGHAYMLTGMVYCAHCGCNMHGQMNTRGVPKRRIAASIKGRRRKPSSIASGSLAANWIARSESFYDGSSVESSYDSTRFSGEQKEWNVLAWAARST